MGAVNVGHIIAFAELRDGMSGPGKKIKQNLLGTAAAAGAAVIALRGVTDVIGSNVRSFVEFEGALNNVMAVSGATGAEFTRLKDLALEMGAQTKFSATEAAKAQGFLAMAGLETNEVMKALPQTLSLAAAGNLELATAADIVTNVMSGFGEPVEEIGRLTDILALSAASANTNVEQMGAAMSYVAPISASVGMSVEETAAAIGLLSNAGIQGERAGTTLRGVLGKLAAPSNEATEIFERLGKRIGQTTIHVENAEGEMLPLVDILAQLEQSGLSAGDAYTIFGQRAGPGLMALLRQGSGALSEFTGELERADGAADDMANTQMRGLVGSMTRLDSTVDTLSVRMGDVMAPAVATVVDWIVDFSGWLQKTDKGVDALAALLAGAFVAALAAAGVAIWALVPAITAATGGLNLVIPLIAGVVAAGVTLAATGSDSYGDYADSVNSTKETVGELTAAVEELKGKTEEAIGDQIYARLSEAAELVVAKTAELQQAEEAIAALPVLRYSEFSDEADRVRAATAALAEAEAGMGDLQTAYREFVSSREFKFAEEERQRLEDVSEAAKKARKQVNTWMQDMRREGYETRRAFALLQIETQNWEYSLSVLDAVADSVFPAVQEYAESNAYMTGKVNEALHQQWKRLKTVKDKTDDSADSAREAEKRFGELAGLFSSVTTFDARSLMGTINQLSQGDWVGAAISAASGFFSWLNGKDAEKKRRQEEAQAARIQQWEDEREAAEAALQAIHDDLVELAEDVIDIGFQTDEWITQLESLPDHIDSDAIKAKFADGLAALGELQGFQKDISSLQSFVGDYASQSALQQFMDSGNLTQAAADEYTAAGGDERLLDRFATALGESTTFEGLLSAYENAEEGSGEQLAALHRLETYMTNQGITEGSIDTRIAATNTLLGGNLTRAADVLEGDIKTTLADIESAIKSQTEELVAAIEGLDLSVTVVTRGGNGDDKGEGHGRGGNGYDGYAKGGLMRGAGLVGEYGPELADPQTPTRIYSNRQLGDALTGSGNSNVPVQLVWKDGRVLAEITAEHMPAALDDAGVR